MLLDAKGQAEWRGRTGASGLSWTFFILLCNNNVILPNCVMYIFQPLASQLTRRERGNIWCTPPLFQKSLIYSLCSKIIDDFIYSIFVLKYLFFSIQCTFSILLIHLSLFLILCLYISLWFFTIITFHLVSLSRSIKSFILEESSSGDIYRSNLGTKSNPWFSSIWFHFRLISGPLPKNR